MAGLRRDPIALERVVLGVEGPHPGFEFPGDGRWDLKPLSGDRHVRKIGIRRRFGESLLAVVGCARVFRGVQLQIGGLQLLPRFGGVSLLLAVAAGLAFGVCMALADALVFRSVIPASQAVLLSNLSAAGRIAYFAPFVVIEELIYRLAAMTACVWLLTKIFGPQAWCYWAAILISAVILYPAAHHAYLAALVPGALTVTREILLHGGAGVLWGWLYWRHGFCSAVVGHLSAHLSLQQLLGILFG